MPSPRKGIQQSPCALLRPKSCQKSMCKMCISLKLTTWIGENQCRIFGKILESSRMPVHGMVAHLKNDLAPFVRSGKRAFVPQTWLGQGEMETEADIILIGQWISSREHLHRKPWIFLRDMGFSSCNLSLDQSIEVVVSSYCFQSPGSKFVCVSCSASILCKDW